MKQILRFVGIALMLLTMNNATAQTRYLEEVFDNVNIQPAVSFGFNVDALRTNFADLAGFQADMVAVNTLIANNEPVPTKYFVSNGTPGEDPTVLKLFPLRMDVYTPAGDTETNRPVILYLHTGNFLPPIINGGITGSRADSVVVNLCKKWAKSGYTVAAVSYRLGWNPISTDPDVRRGTLLQAVYRALHDTQTAVRFMRASHATQSNPFGIDPDKIILFGQGSGGYVAQAYNTLDNYVTEIASLPKFIGADGFPYVLEARDGNIDGGPGALRLPDPLQQAGFSREISMAVNAGGALADISWLDGGEAPMVSFHCVRDPFAPFDDGTVVVPTTNENVVDVSGANVFMQQAAAFGNNYQFVNFPAGDPYTDRARAIYGETYEYILPAQPTITVASAPEGLFPVVRPMNTLNGNRFTNESDPWTWWDFATLEVVVAATNAALGLTGSPNAYNATVLHAQGLAGNPGMGVDKGMAYIDTIHGYLNPRMMCVLGLEGVNCGPVNTNNPEVENSTSVFPNPSSDALTIRNNEFMIRRVELYDITGRLVSQQTVNANELRFERGNFSEGVYMLSIIFDDHRITKKVLFN
jgi:hypothetical protein